MIHDLRAIIGVVVVAVGCNHGACRCPDRTADDGADLRGRLKAPANDPEQALYVSETLKTGRVMVKDENICLHCGMCAERCPTGAWDMQKFYIETAQAGREAPRT